jgi:hypothetical protein
MLLEKIAGQCGDGLVFEKQGLGERSEHLLERPGQVHDENRIDAVGLHRHPGVDAVRGALEGRRQQPDEIADGLFAEVIGMHGLDCRG